MTCEHCSASAWAVDEYAVACRDLLQERERLRADILRLQLEMAGWEHEARYLRLLVRARAGRDLLAFVSEAIAQEANQAAAAEPELEAA